MNVRAEWRIRRCRQRVSSWRALFVIGLALFLLSNLCLFRAALATTLISQGYFVSGPVLPPGSIVSLENNTSDYVNAPTTADSTDILGVVISDNNSLVSLSTDQSNQVQVATNGIAQVLVSDINGNIANGDPITASPIKGVGMKATDSVKVVGIAQGAFPNTTAKQQSYTDQKGQKHNVMLGEVPVLVNVAYYYKQPAKTLIPAAIQDLADAMAGKQVDSLPILISIGVFILTLIIVVSIIYAMIHGSIISVGRNPMSQAAVYRNMMQLSALIVAILIVAVGSIYMILTRF